ncbi:hypothetical protein PAMP_020211 [Pampus punctatissimus]
MMTILTNCVVMMTDSPGWSEIAEYVFIAIYTFEAIIKILSRGFCVGHFTFLRDPWNWLDVIIISTAYLTVFADLGNVSVMSAFRAIRILKIIAVVPGLRTTVGTLIQLVKRLMNVFTITVFFLSIFAVVGLLLYMGVLKNKCVLPFPPVNNQNYSSYFNIEETESNGSDYENQYHMPGHIDTLVCGNSTDAGSCPENYICVKTGVSPNYGFTSYDTFGWAFLATLRLMTQDFWENLAQLTLRGAGKVNMIYFVVVLFFGSFYLLSLFLAVIAMATVEHSKAAVAEAKRREEEFNEILQALKKSEEVEEELQAELSDKKDSAPQRKNSADNTAEGFQQDHRWKCCGCWRRLKQWLYTVVTDLCFDLFIIICIILNSVFIFMVHYPMTAEFEHMLCDAHLIFTSVFTVEMILKIVAMDPYGYFKVGWNIFDSAVIVLNLVELGLADIQGLSFLYCFRLMRVFRLAKWWPTFNFLMRIVGNAIGALRNLTLVLVIMVFFFSMVGMHLFKGSYDAYLCNNSADCEHPRLHMSDLWHTFLIVFRILCGKWIEPMWDCMVFSGQGTCVVFFMMVLVIGNLLIMSLFMALLLANLAAPEQERRERNIQQIAINRITWIKTWILEHICMKEINSDNTVVESEEDNKKEYLALTIVTSDKPMSDVKNPSCNQSNLTSNYHDTVSTAVPFADENKSKTPENEEKQQNSQRDDVQKVQEKKDDKDHDGNTPEDCCSDKCYQCCPILDIDMSHGKWRVWSNFRKCCFSFVEHKFFKMFITFIILLSCASLAFEDIYLDSRQVLKVVLEYADLVFTCVFVVEMILKVVAFGFKRYFTNGWCWLDFLVVIVSLVSVASINLGYSDLKPIKCLRALRTVSRFQSTRVVVDVLLSLAPSIIDMLLVSMIVFSIFSILGVHLFAGKFYYCYNATFNEAFLNEQIPNKTKCFELIEANFTEIYWKNAPFHFDNLNAGSLSLLIMATFKGWMNIMYAAVDATEVMDQPKYENNPYMWLYFICFIIGFFFIFNLFIRVFLNKINQLSHKIWKHVFLTEGQKMYYRAKKIQFNNNKHNKQTPPRPQNKLRALVFDLVTRQCFEIFMIMIICITVVTLMIETDDQSEEKEIIMYWIYFIYIIIFTIESILKIIALGRGYFRDRWHLLDFVIIILSIIGLFFTDIIYYYLYPPGMINMIRLVRIIHILPLMPGIRSLLWALVMSLPALFNIGLLLFIIMFTFSVFGMSNFAYVKKEVIESYMNFDTFLKSMTCMFTITTTTGLDSVIIPIMAGSSDCDSYIDEDGTLVSGNCANSIVGVVFFTFYIIISFLLIASMYIAIILEIFDMDAEDSSDSLSEDELQMFYNTWEKFDPDASQCIQYSKLSEFCDSLKEPLRIPKPNTIRLIHMNLPLLPGDKIHYLDILLALSAQVFGDLGQVDTLKANMEEKFKAKNTSKMSYEPISSTLRRKQEEVAAAVIQRAYRKQRLVSREGTEGRLSQLNGDGDETET